MDSTTRRLTDFRDKTIWIFIVSWAFQSAMYWHRQPVLSWVSLAALVLFLPLAIHFQIEKRRTRLAQQKVEA